MGVLQAYLTGLRAIHATGEAVKETSYYGQLEKLLNDVGATLTPKVTCVLTTKNRGAGIPDGGFFVAQKAVVEAGDTAMLARAPERGVAEVKGVAQNVVTVAKSKQVRKYLERYGKVLVTNYRDFLVVNLGDDSEPSHGERFTLAKDENSFWALNPAATEAESGGEFEEYLKRALLGNAPLSRPEDLAWFLAAYARTARERIDKAGRLEALKALRRALEQALGLRFDGRRGEDFFRSALVQTLFYGVFAAWVVWSERQAEDSEERFSWKQAQWTLNVPMVRVLYQQLASPATLPVGLDEVLDWTEDVFARVDRKLFFQNFEASGAVQYFYEPFLQAYDPDLRKDLGVWYTPSEVVRYMVGRVHEALKRDLGLPLGLADEQVHVLDPCTGTGSFLVETIRVIAGALEEEHGDELVGQEAKQAALTRVHGFELLPAPFVVAHLQLGLLLDQLGAPLEPNSGERASVFLTNALTGWEQEQHQQLPFEEFAQERDLAENVKRTEPILVVLGNPPYNGFAGVSGDEEGGLVLPYKRGLSRAPWEVTKNKLDDLYIRFFRIAERCITERSRRGIVCFISNYGWLGDPSNVLMRKRFISEFDRIYIDNLNGDSRETGKKTPEGDPDPSVFSTKLNTPGIQVGTAVSLLVRTEPHATGELAGLYRDFWGQTKRADLEASLSEPQAAPRYEELTPDEKNWFRLRRWAPRKGYEKWPAVTELVAEKPQLGLNENRDEGLIDIDKDALTGRMEHFLDPDTSFDELDASTVSELLQPWARYKAKTVHSTLLSESPYSEDRVKRFQVKPFDVRWAYVETNTKLWNEARSDYVKAAELGSDFLLVRRRSPRALDGAAFLLSRSLIDQHVLHKDAYTVPLLLPSDVDEDAAHRLFEGDEESTNGLPWRPNLSKLARDHLAELGYDDAEHSQATAELVWMHVLAIGYSPLYLEQNGDAIRNDWPRVPLGPTRETLESSAKLGRRLAALLDIDTPLPGTDTSPAALLKTVAAIARADGAAPKAGDLRITAGWGVERVRENAKTGAVSHAVMPGNGEFGQRARTEAEKAGLSDEQCELLGDEVVDVWLNKDVCWRGIPQAAWDFKIGGFQVLRKWLSYREASLLGRPLTLNEARQFTNIARRLTRLVLLGPELDDDYRAAIGEHDQDSLWEAEPVSADTTA